MLYFLKIQISVPVKAGNGEVRASRAVVKAHGITLKQEKAHILISIIRLPSRHIGTTIQKEGLLSNRFHLVVIPLNMDPHIKYRSYY